MKERLGGAPIRIPAPERKEPEAKGAGFSVFNYFDYRSCLDDFFRHRKNLNSRFSHRVFARMAGYRSTGLFIQLIRGKANLTRAMIPRFAKAMGLGAAEIIYFENLVHFTHARTAEARQHWFEAMVPLLPPRNRVLAVNQQRYYEKWYHVAIREALSVLPVAGDARELAKLLKPAISSKEATSALKALAELGLINRNADGFWKATDAILESNPALGPLLIHPFQAKLIGMGEEALHRFPRDERNVSCITFSLSEAGFQRLSLKVDRFLKDVAHLVRSEADPDRVCQFNIQLFPLTGRKS